MVRTNQKKEASCGKEVSFSVNLEDFTDEDIDPNDIYFFTIGKSPIRDEDDNCCYDFNLVYKSEVTSVYNKKLQWKMLKIAVGQLSHEDKDSDLIFQFYKNF